MLKNFQVGRYKFQGWGGWKNVEMRLIKNGNRNKTHRNKACVRVEKFEGNVPMQNGIFQLRVEISTLVILVTVFSISS